MRYLAVPITLTALAILPACSATDLEPLKSNASGFLQSTVMPTAPSQAQTARQPKATPPRIASTGGPAQHCATDVVESLLTPATQDPTPVKLTCSVKLPPNASITRQVIFEGSSASGAALDCSGGTVSGTAARGDKDAIVVRSKKTPNGWDRPVGVTVKNCRIAGSIRIYGLGRNGEAADVKASSLTPNHTAFAQAAAPSNITFDRVEITASSATPFYVSPGVTGATLSNSTLKGTSASAAVYLDAESAGARIVGNTFSIKSGEREQVAIDGSAYNEISGNRFLNVKTGGIYAYRNCGEGGTIRHQSPQFNTITNNTFEMSGLLNAPAVWLNSRNGNRSYCFQDPSHPFGSSTSPLDFAQNNTVEGNRSPGATIDPYRNNDPSNRVSGNN